jgi:hypothetical protein
MSNKITAKNLTYDTSLPPFLARLRGQQSAHSGPDPILAAHRRPGQKRSASEEAEDAPLVVDEHGNVVELEDELVPGSEMDRNDKRQKGERGEEKGAEMEGDGGIETDKDREKVAGIGAARKRKVGRVVGEQSGDDVGEGNNKKSKDKNDEARIAKASADVRRLLHDEDEDSSSRRDIVPKGGEQKPQGGPQKIKGTKKKVAKKIKLSFGD